MYITKLYRGMFDEVDRINRMTGMMKDYDFPGMETLAIKFLKPVENVYGAHYVFTDVEPKVRGKITTGPVDVLDPEDVTVGITDVVIEGEHANAKFKLVMDLLEDMPQKETHRVHKIYAHGEPKNYFFMVQEKFRWKDVYFFDSDGRLVAVSKDDFARQGSRFVACDRNYKNIMSVIATIVELVVNK